MSASTRYVFDMSEGDASLTDLLGGKGAHLAEMTRLGIRVPDGFTVTTTASRAVMELDGRWPEDLWEQTLDAIERLEQRTGRTLGGAVRPLLLSVRSGAVVSMPGMMDTILNLGIGPATVETLGEEVGSPRFAWDSYRRFVQMYGDVVEGVPAHEFEDLIAAQKRTRGVELDTDLDVDDLRALVAQFIDVTQEHTGRPLPTDPREQLRRAIDAVFSSWRNPRADIYRKAHGIPFSLGTAVNVMQMVFGNRGDTSATGVCFTRNPSTGAAELYGEFLLNAQGEDVVAGTRTPRPIAEMADLLPEPYSQLRATMAQLESHYGDMQDIEFTVEDGELYLLQTRSGKRTAAAAFTIVTDLVREGAITREQAVQRIDPAQLEQLLHPAIQPDHGHTPLTRGLNASPGAAVGRVVFTAQDAIDRHTDGEGVVLVRWETTPDDIGGTIAAEGVLTAHGGMTSHAAVVARGMGRPCVAGAAEVRIDTAAGEFRVGSRTVKEGDLITLDGSTGEVYLGALTLVEPGISQEVATVAGWADDIRRLGVRANADTPQDAITAREFGAEGIGLCRTEHMFMSAERLPVVRRMILAHDEEERQKSLGQLLPMQQDDFEAILEAMSGLPVTIRLLDPPLHEFLPDLLEQALLVQRLELTGGTDDELREARGLLGRIKELTEANPMLGTRGVRLALLHPEIPRMQVRAIARAARAVQRRGFDPRVEIMVPLISTADELERMRTLIEKTLTEELHGSGGSAAADHPEIRIGTMIELPRAAVAADHIAAHADFFSFGTNDLTQTALGMSRDDAEAGFLTPYLESGLLAHNPFATVDVDGVGALVALGAQGGRRTSPDLKLGVCGEHGGDPTSIVLFEALDLDYVSCSPYRVPIARLAAAQAHLNRGGIDRDDDD